MTSYSFRDERGDIVATYPRFAPPRPAHTETPAARAAVAAHRAVAERDRLERVKARLTTDVGMPAVVVVTEQVAEPSAAAKLDEEARVAGFETHSFTSLDGLFVLEGHRPGREGEPRWLGFRAWWKDGRTAGATWCEPERYELVTDDRPPRGTPGLRTGAKVRPSGVGRVRLSLAGSPSGIAIGVQELTRRLKGSVE